MSNYGIPKWMLSEIRQRDVKCVYCGRDFSSTVRPSIEHIINDISIISFENIAICCIGCNASKGQKKLSEWVNSKYCKDRNIDHTTFSKVILDALRV
jgi:hypothetical protein